MFARAVMCTTALGLCVMAQEAQAQSSPNSALPPVTVDSPVARRAPAPVVRRAAARPQRVAAPRRVVTPNPAATNIAVENPRGAVQGYVAGRSLAGTKTNTPIIQTPQSLSVIGAEQIRDQNVAKLDEALRYTPGVFGGTFGADTRQDWIQIRGFPVQDVGTFLDGLQLFSTAFATWKLQPFSLSRVEILRGPSAVLYGGTGQSGIINAVSKFAGPAEPIKYIEAGVNNFGNAYTRFDFGGPVTVSPTGNSNLFYRVVGEVRGGGTQVDFTNDDGFFIAPSLTYTPDLDTRFTVYGQAVATRTRGQNFLPYVGTVVDAPFGRIPTRLFASDPAIDTYRRDQQMIGYQFEKNLSENSTFRQNARFAHVNTQITNLFGLGYATTPADANLARGLFKVFNDATQATVDSQYEYRFATGPVQHTTLIGLDLKRYGIDDLQPFGSANSLNLVTGAQTPSAFTYQFNLADRFLSQAQAGIYLQDQMKFGRFTLVLSGRNDWVDTVNNNRAGPQQARDDSKFSGRAGLIYNFDEGVAPYVSYATSYNPVLGTNGATGQLLLPETGEQVEVGVKYEPLGQMMRFGVAVFDLKRKNALTTLPNGVNQVIQNGEVTSRGIELEAVANITPDFKLVASYTNFNLFINNDANPALIGLVPTNTPRQFASLWTDYTIRGGWLDGFGFGGGVRYVGSSYADVANTMVVPSVVLGDLAVHYEWNRNWRAAVNVINVADTTYVSACQGVGACFYGDRRRITGNVSYKW